MAGPHHHHGGHHHGGGRRGFRGPDVVYVEAPYAYAFDCPPGWYYDQFGVCRPIASLQSAAGAGDIRSNILLIAPALSAMSLAWQSFDPLGRTTTQAIADAYVRAASKSWKKDAASKADLMALVIGSAFQAKVIDDGTATNVRAADALARTWAVFAKKTGYAGQSADNVKMTLGSQGPQTKAAIALIEVLLLLGVAIVVAGVYAWVIYKVAEIVETWLAVDAESDELIRLHAEWQKIVDRHIKDPNLPWTPEELQILKNLEDAQAGLHKQLAPPSPFSPVKPIDTTTIVVLAAAAGAAYFFFLRKRSA